LTIVPMLMAKKRASVLMVMESSDDGGGDRKLMSRPSPWLPLVRYSAACASQLAPCVSQFDERGISYTIWRARHIIYCPRMPSLRRSLIWMLRSVSHDVTWWHDPIYHNQRLKIRLSFRWLNILCRNTFFSCIKYDKKYVNSQKECSTASNSTRRLSTAWHEDYLLLPSHAFRTSRLFWQLISLLRMFCWVSATFSWAA
jgi:hypothetical protein